METSRDFFKRKTASLAKLVALGVLPAALFLGAPAMAATPGGVTDPTLWLRADTGASASSWTDQSTSANNATQSTAAAQPTPSDSVTDTINFNPVMKFDGTTDFLNLDISKLPTGNTARSIFVIGRLSVVTGNDSAIGKVSVFDLTLIPIPG